MKQPGDAVNMSQFNFVEIYHPINLSRRQSYTPYSAGDGGSRSIYILETPWDAHHWRLRSREMHLLNLIPFFSHFYVNRIRQFPTQPSVVHWQLNYVTSLHHFRTSHSPSPQVLSILSLSDPSKEEKVIFWKVRVFSTITRKEDIKSLNVYFFYLTFVISIYFFFFQSSSSSAVLSIRACCKNQTLFKQYTSLQ